MPKYLGNRDPYGGLDTFDNPGVNTVRMICKEVTAMCPVTGQPDFYNIFIDYKPDKLCIESKSMKLFLQTFREKGTFGEGLAVAIRDEVWEAIRPFAVEIHVMQTARGGIGIDSSASQERQEYELGL